MLQKQTCDGMRPQLTGFMRTQSIAAAATLSLAEPFHQGPRTVEEIARLTGLEKELTCRFSRALAASGLVASADERTFAALPPLETLPSTVPGSLRDVAMLVATPGQSGPWGSSLQGLPTGAPRATTALGADLLDDYRHHPEEVASCHKTMHMSTAGVTAESGPRLDTSQSRMAVDVGGATGPRLSSSRPRHPQLRGRVYDRPENVARAQAAAVALGLAARSTAVAGEFLASVPAGDLSLLRFILPDWKDADGRRRLTTCRRAMRPHSRVALVEAFRGRVGQDVPPDTADRQGALIDLQMVVVAGGRERSVSPDADLLQHADRSLTAATPLPSGDVLMEATATGER
jgi:O-methyltransferase domain